MLQPYFAFGVPLFLLVLYLLFALIHRQTTIHYLRFILLLISTFLMVFSFQVLQESWTINPETLKDAVMDSFRYRVNPHTLQRLARPSYNDKIQDR